MNSVFLVNPVFLNFYNLNYVTLTGIKNITSFSMPHYNLIALKIIDCSDLTSINLEENKSLNKFKVSRLFKLKKVILRGNKNLKNGDFLNNIFYNVKDFTLDIRGTSILPINLITFINNCSLSLNSRENIEFFNGILPNNSFLDLYLFSSNKATISRDSRYVHRVLFAPNLVWFLTNHNFHLMTNEEIIFRKSIIFFQSCFFRKVSEQIIQIRKDINNLYIALTFLKKINWLSDVREIENILEKISLYKRNKEPQKVIWNFFSFLFGTEYYSKELLKLSKNFTFQETVKFNDYRKIVYNVINY